MSASFGKVRKAILDNLGEPLAETDIDDAAHAAIKAAKEIEPEISAALRREFGYVTDLQDGEQWTVYQNRTLIVIHPERRPRLYKRGCGGVYYEIEPDFL
ncbi:hypothetical protein ACQR1I_36035 [Bradyrhizobium sp. HKCCYLS2038]|uniref:hypothetical protein n=1 Tax=Bradyrhizobium sp. HKCCYLS2038 TaxID=3420764 RepID=UPI003EBBA6B6